MGKNHSALSLLFACYRNHKPLPLAKGAGKKSKNPYNYLVVAEPPTPCPGGWGCHQPS